MFPDGSVETSVRFFDVQHGAGGGWARVDVAPPDPELRAEQNRERAERHAKRELRLAVICIGADRLLSCTYRDNMRDLAVAREHWRVFVKLVRARYPQWQYAEVPEQQQRGAIHFHAAVKGRQHWDYLRACWRRAIGGEGNIDVTPEFRRWGSRVEARSCNAIASYLAKYIGKAFGWMPKGARRWTASAERQRPSVQRWWLDGFSSDGEVMALVYRATCGDRALGVRQWLSPDGAIYWVCSAGPPRLEQCPF